jgi:hypothetical protein
MTERVEHSITVFAFSKHGNRIGAHTNRAGAALIRGYTPELVTRDRRADRSCPGRSDGTSADQ